MHCRTNSPRRCKLVLAAALVVVSIIGASCSSDQAVTEEPALTPIIKLPTAVAAPTPEGAIVEEFGSPSDAQLAVVGTPADQSIALHALPGIDEPVLLQIPGNAGDIVGEDQAFESDDGLTWLYVRYGNRIGWVSERVAYLGPATPFDSAVTVAGSISDPGLFASEVVTRVGEQQGGGLTPVVVTSATSADGSTRTVVDLMATGDDSQLGWRVLVTSATDESGNQTLAGINRQPICARGVVDGLCE